MIRRFNYTGRKKIKRWRVALTLLPRGNEPPAFDAKFRLEGLELPDAAHVYVEAYHKQSYMRFPFGRVGEIQSPNEGDRRLTEIAERASALFRVKVVDESAEWGQILAEADGLSPLDGNQANANRVSLLPVMLKDLGNSIWELDFSDDRPVLVLNQEIPDIHMIARGDEFFSLVYPSIVERVLLQILVPEEYHDLDGDSDDWKCQWLKFACQLPGIFPPPQPVDNAEENWEAQLGWIRGVTAAFCERQDIRSRFMRVQSAGE